MEDGQRSLDTDKILKQLETLTTQMGTHSLPKIHSTMQTIHQAYIEMG